MRTIYGTKKLFVFLCILVIIACGCNAQAENTVLNAFYIPSTYSIIQAPKARAEVPAVLEEEQWTASDDVVSQEHPDDRKSGAGKRFFMRLSLFYSLLIVSAALFAYLFARVFHGSSSPTYGLFCILEFIQSADGRKDKFFSLT